MLVKSFSDELKRDVNYDSIRKEVCMENMENTDIVNEITADETGYFVSPVKSANKTYLNPEINSLYEHEQDRQKSEDRDLICSEESEQKSGFQVGDSNKTRSKSRTTSCSSSDIIEELQQMNLVVNTSEINVNSTVESYSSALKAKEMVENDEKEVETAKTINKVTKVTKNIKNTKNTSHSQVEKNSNENSIQVSQCEVEQKSNNLNEFTRYLHYCQENGNKVSHLPSFPIELWKVFHWICH